MIITVEWRERYGERRESGRHLANDTRAGTACGIPVPEDEDTYKITRQQDIGLRGRGACAQCIQIERGQ